jgi:hypothetical protein
MDNCTQWDTAHGQAIAGFDIHIIPCLNRITNFYTSRRQDIPFFTVRVKKQCNIGRTVWVIFNGSNLGWDINLVPLKVNDPVLSFVPPFNFLTRLFSGLPLESSGLIMETWFRFPGDVGLYVLIAISNPDNFQLL